MAQRKNHKTPAAANWLAARFIADHYHEEFFGDLEEIYTDRIASSGRLRAAVMYWFDTLHLLVGFQSTTSLKTQNNRIMMFRTMFKIAWRNAIRQKQFTILNILGLTIGIATCLVIALYVWNEMTFDTFHAKEDRIYRVNQPLIWSNWDEQFASTGPNVAIALREDALEFEEVTRLLSWGTQLREGTQTVRRYSDMESNTIFREDRYFAADDNFFKVFSFDFIQGDPNTALQAPMSMVITQETALRYFGDEDPIGRLLEVKQRNGSWRSYSIRGVIEDISHKSHLQFDILVSMSSYAETMKANDWKWIWTAFSTYGLVKGGTDLQLLTEKIQAIPPKWAAVTTERIFNTSFDEYVAGKEWRLYLQPLRDIYLSESPDQHRFGPTGNPQSVKIFSAIGFLVLILCSINFMNLATARSSNRAKEVGIKKALGSQRRTLVQQFVFESILFVTVSAIGAIGLVLLSLDMFNAIIGKQLELLPHLANPIFLGLILSFVLLLGTLAGTYPAFYLSSFKPIETLKGKFNAGMRGKSFRNGLVICQFTISIALIICAVFVQRQLIYTSSLDLGFAKDNILQIHNIEQLNSSSEAFKTTLEANSAFVQIGKSFDVPPNIWDGERYKANKADAGIDISNFRAEGDYLELLGVEFLAGRNFQQGSLNDRYGVVLNEEAVKQLGWGTPDTYSTDSPIGKFVICAFDNEEELEVLGVVKDFNFNSVRQQIDPLIIINPENDKIWNYGLGRSYLSLRLNPKVVKNASDLQQHIEKVKEEMAQMDASIMFEYSFMDREFNDAFNFELRMGKVINLFTLMALIIACLGLFGLAAFSAENRIKELGIRKVLGAKVSQVAILFSSEFTKLILISVVLAAPISYFFVDQWLSDFAYRTPIDIWVFAVAGLGAFVMAIVTVGYQSIMAAFKNPVDTLKED